MPVVFLRIPDERLGVVIGGGGETKRAIESRTGTTIEIEEEEEAIRLVAPDTGDPIGLMKARDVVQAIGRGFSPERAFRLLKDDTYLGVIDIKQATGKRTKDAIWRIRSRVIGAGGRARQRLEELSGCAVSVQGATVALIGDERQLERGTRAVQLLLRGSEHSTVFRMLVHERREAALADVMGPSEPPEEL
ncbi:MAG TPA: KH domain-containing protein [Thermoplasmata archaeon]|nr:KH domain-containing protein [Thermoplasmata archaeon]